MAIDVKVACSDCGTVTDDIIRVDDKEILCPDCRRMMPNVPKEDFTQVEKTQSSQRLMGVFALVLMLGAAALLVFWAGAPSAWVSTADQKYLARNPREDTTMFFAAAAGCALIAGILGALASRKRFVVEI